MAYRLADRDFYLPYLKLISAEDPDTHATARRGGPELELSEGDVGLLCDSISALSWIPSSPLRREADSALRKLTFDLGERWKQPGASPVLYLDRPGAEEIRTRVRALSDALLARKNVRFTYHGIARGEATEREVSPYGLLFQSGHWYLVGHDALRDGLRVFRIGRMDEPRANAKAPKSPDYEIPEDFSLEAYRGRDAWELGSEDDQTLRARVLFEFPSSLWADRNGYGEKEQELPDGSQVRAFDVRQVNPFLRWILSLEGRARIAAPTSLVDGLRSMAEEVLAVYEASAAEASAAAPGGAHE
jgi:proteasome accessory factor B